MAGASDGRDSLPWASLLDPIANAKAFGDIQAQALRAAGDLVERLAAAADANATQPRPSGDRPTAPDDTAATNGDASRLIDAWVEMLQRVSTSFMPGRAGRAGDGSDGRDGRVEVDIDGGTPPRSLRLVVDPSGGTPPGTLEAWLHNGTGTSFGPLTMRPGDLRSPAGELLTSALVCDPAHIEELPPRSSRGVALSLEPDGVLSEGVYRGVVQVEGAPNVWLPVEVVVTASAP